MVVVVSIDQYHKLTVHLVYFGPTRLLSQACRLYVDVACFCSMVRMSVGHMGKLCVRHTQLKRLTCHMLCR